MEKQAKPAGTQRLKLWDQADDRFRARHVRDALLCSDISNREPAKASLSIVKPHEDDQDDIGVQNILGVLKGAYKESENCKP